jgi:hypothetical protein
MQFRCPVYAAFVMVEDHLCVMHDRTIDAEVAFDHSLSRMAGTKATYTSDKAACCNMVFHP